jgi:hypothetical protein
MLNRTGNKMELNRELLVADIERHRHAAGANQSRLKHWAVCFGTNAILFLVALPMLNGEFMETFDPANPDLYYWLAASVIGTFIQVALGDRQHRRSPTDVDQIVSAYQKNADRYSGPGWLTRTILMGIWLGLGVGIPVALLAVLFMPAEYGVGRERWEGVAYFLALTFAWTMPMAFLIRLISMMSFRKYSQSQKSTPGTQVG